MISNPGGANAQHGWPMGMYSCRQKSAYSNGTASAETLESTLCAMQVAVRPASVSRRAPAAVTVAVKNACAASCKA